ELAVGPELVDAEHGDLGMVGMARGLRGMRLDPAEATAVAQKVVDLELLARHDHDVGVEPRAVNGREARVVQRLDVHAVNLGADLRPQPTNLDDDRALPMEARVSSTALQVRSPYGRFPWRPT